MIDVRDVMKAYQVMGSDYLLGMGSVTCVKTKYSFMEVIYKEYDEIKNESGSTEETDSTEENELGVLLEELQNYSESKRVNFNLKGNNTSEIDKREEKKLLDQQEILMIRKRKMLEEMLIKRRLMEMERIKDGAPGAHSKKLPYLDGVSAAELLSGLV